ncbi:RidA family protein [Angelakisella massiliensis]|uniref:RidA family protein n=1 Tax=Angelakisella massiliensis TaxID=1871018 RepID=UPI0008F8414F|nr:RidA family protein [Angelakisella massiliensis]
MQIIRSVDRLKCNGHYALAVVEGGNVYISGQFSTDPDTGEKKFGPIEQEARQVLKNIQRILQAAGSDKSKVLKSTIYLDSLQNWEKIDQIYSDFFGDCYHARTIACVKELHYGFKLEMDVIASL